MRLQGKNAIVTGARSGIGRAIVELFAREGANIWAIVHREDKEWLSAMEKLATELHVWIKPVYIDLSNEEQIKQGMQTIIKEKLPIDILVNAAGIVSENRLIQMTTMQTMHDVMNVNFFAAVQVAQLASRVMCRQKSGSIINIASIAGMDGDYAQLEYAASKAALICATKKMAFEWGNFGIRVNAIAPGMTETKMIGGMDDKVTEDMIRHNTLGRKGTPQEVAQLVLYLASEESTYITAQTIRVDGGGTNFISTINR
jgi:3-oxoacyl-[acyl-carrier protein] reductase